jgi:integrase
VQVGNQVDEHGPKSRAYRRTLPLPEPVSLALAGIRLRQRQERATAGRAVPAGLSAVRAGACGGRRAGPAVPAGVVSDEFDRQVRAAGLRRVPLHGVRHAAASPLGVPILHVAAWLGQSQLSVTAGYQHFGAAGLAEVARRFPDVLSPERCETSVRDDLSSRAPGCPGHYRSCS